eukprot:SM000004S14972  [mRNA]  locus=s4:536113:537672:+ [translate_table: standard]
MALQGIVMSAVVGILYSNLKKNQKSIQDRQGVLFFTAIFTAFNGIFQMITTFPSERAIITRERSANSYRVSAYYPGKVVAEWPLRIMGIAIYVLIVYWIVHLQQTAAKFFIFGGIVLLEFTAMNAAGLLVSSIAPTPQVALALGPLVTVIFMLFGGFYVNLDNIPGWIRWFSKCSPLQWGFVGLAINEFRGETFSCKATDDQCYRTGDAVLEHLSVGQYSIGEAVGWQILIIAVLHTLAFLALMRNRPRMQPLSAISVGTSKAATAAVRGPAAIGPVQV